MPPGVGYKGSKRRARGVRQARSNARGQVRGLKRARQVQALNARRQASSVSNLPDGSTPDGVTPDGATPSGVTPLPTKTSGTSRSAARAAEAVAQRRKALSTKGPAGRKQRRANRKAKFGTTSFKEAQAVRSARKVGRKVKRAKRAFESL